MVQKTRCRVEATSLKMLRQKESIGLKSQFKTLVLYSTGYGALFINIFLQCDKSAHFDTFLFPKCSNVKKSIYSLKCKEKLQSLKTIVIICKTLLSTKEGKGPEVILLNELIVY